MKASYIPPVRTPVSPVDVSRAYRHALSVITGVNPKPEAVAVLHAQCALETGHMKSCWNFGVGNVKAGNKYEGLFTCIRLNERMPQPDGSLAYEWYRPEGKEKADGSIDGQVYTVPDGHPQTRMRAFRNLGDGVRDKIRFLNEPNWRPALAHALTGNAGAYVKAIKALGYFTSDVEKYMRAVVSLTAKLLPVARGVAEETEAWDDQTCLDVAECMQVEVPDWLRDKVESLVLTSMVVDWDEHVTSRDASVKDRQ